MPLDADPTNFLKRVHINENDEIYTLNEIFY